MKIKLLLVFLAVSIFSQRINAQAIGHTTITFNDPSRTGGFGSGGGAGRQIQTEIYYPAATAGTDVPCTGTNLPVIILGHGFVMTWDAYTNIWTHLVPQGYVIALPRTEGNSSPVHVDFAKDLNLVVSRVKSLGHTATSIFYMKLGSTSAIMGHSMGGGASFLAGSGNDSITTLVTFAAAITNPSCVAPSATIKVPVLIMSGDHDGVAPPAKHQDSMYVKLFTGLSGSIPNKTQVYIKGGGHCGFSANSNTCLTGEGLSTPAPAISESFQSIINLDFTDLWLRFYLKSDCSAAPLFQDSLTQSPMVSYRQNMPLACLVTSVNSGNLHELNLFPNPAGEQVFISGLAPDASSEVTVFDVRGQKLGCNLSTEGGNLSVSLSGLEEGFYFLNIRQKGINRTLQFIKRN